MYAHETDCWFKGRAEVEVCWLKEESERCWDYLLNGHLT